MKRRYRIYLDTSFWGRLEETTLQKDRRTSYRFLNRSCRGHDILVSPLVLDEIRRNPTTDVRRRMERRLFDSYRIMVAAGHRARSIGRELREEGRFSDTMIADLTHVGYAMVGFADALVTWDARTLARDKVRLAVDAYCRREARPAPRIGLPEEVAKWLSL